MEENVQERAEKLAAESIKRDLLQENLRKCLEEERNVVKREAVKDAEEAQQNQRNF